MSHPFVRLPAFALCACALALTWVVGCNPPNGATADVHDHDHEHDHDDHGHADTYAGAVEEIENYAAQIKEAFAAGTPAESDDALHELGHVMLDLADLAKRAGATGTNLEEIEAAIDKAMDAYGTLDKAIHNDDFDAAYDDHAEDIDAALATLVANVETLEGDHDHDGAGHDDDQHQADHDDEHGDHDHDHEHEGEDADK